MATVQDEVRIEVDGQSISGTVARPNTAMPGVLFVHGWGGSQDRDLARAQEIASLGCVCLTFDLRGHAQTGEQYDTVTRDDNLNDVLAAYDVLADHPNVDRSNIAIIGSSYGGYLATLATELRPVRWLALRVPALYRDTDWDRPKADFDRAFLQEYRRRGLAPADNRALAACEEFRGNVLLVESELDHLVPHQTILNYRAAFRNAISVTYRVLEGADHALTERRCRRHYLAVLVNWLREMIFSARIGPSALTYDDLD